VLVRDDDYASAGKPACDYEDRAAREGLVDALAKDAMALLGVLDGLEVTAAVGQAAQLVATVVGQDLDQDGPDGVFGIARRVAPDRVISTVDPQARHGHKTSARGFDGYQGHLAIDPDSEIITATTATPGNTGDAEAAADLLAQDLPAADGEAGEADADAVDVYGDAAYGAGELLEELERAGADIHTKVQPPSAPGGRFPKDRFDIDQDAGTVTCPGEVRVPIRPANAGGGTAVFGAACAGCPLVAQCTSSPAGRTIRIGRHEAQLTRARGRQKDPAWQGEYRATRPKVERKIGHLMHRGHGGRRARVRGRPKVAADFALLAAAVNLARLGVLGITGTPNGNWGLATS